jgi:hypothetical protein
VSAEDPWESARTSAREDVRGVLARREVQTTCAHCGWSGTTAAARCPDCGRLWSARRRKGLSPASRRRAIAAGLVALVAAAITAAIAIPRIDDSKRSTAARERAATARLRAQRVAELRVQQRPRHARAAPAGPRDRAARTATVDTLERDITRDARAQVRAHTLRGPVLRTTCEAYPVNVGLPRVPLAQPVGRYQCYAVTSEVRRANGSDVGFIGQPFWARATFATGALVWCRTNPRPGERGLQVLSPEVAISPECDPRH